ncbi:MAG: tRNA lysidine(34) synthetase TilS [Oscillospiraceae bacterium]
MQQGQANKRIRQAMERAEDAMRRWEMLPERGGGLLCAVSGGLDSVCLLHFLRRLAEKEGFRLTAAHYNHRLRREDSEADARFVEELCADWGVPCVAGEGDVRQAAAERGWSLEEAARNCRYDFLRRTAEALGAEKIATAHQAEDNAETVLLQLTRGAGSEGACGIPPVRGPFVRPFLTVSRRELEMYAAAYGLPCRQDASNADLRFSRNRIRHEVMPVLTALNPEAAKAMGRAAAVRRQESELLSRIAEAELGEVRQERGGAAAARQRFCETEPCLIPRMLGLLLERAGAGRKDISARHFEAMERLVLTGGDKAELSLPGGYVACNRGESFWIGRRQPETAERRPLSPGETVRWGDYLIRCEKSKENFLKNRDTIALKYDMMILPLTVGAWDRRQGLSLPGGRGRRSLKRLFAEAGLSCGERERTPVFYAGERACAAAVLGADADFLPGEGEEALVLKITRIEREQE